MRGLKQGWKYIQTIIRWRMGQQMALLIALSVLGALAEGVGVGVLIPMLESLQNASGLGAAPATSGFSSVLANVFERLGIPFTIPAILAVGMSLFIVQAVLTYVRALLTALSQDRLMAAIRARAFGNLVNANLAYFHKSRLGELTDALTTEALRAGAAFGQMIQMIATLILLAAYLAVEITISWQLALAAFPLLGLLAIALRPRRSYDLGAEMTQENESLQSIALESLGGIREIKALGLEALSLANFRRSAERLVAIDVRLQNYGYRFTMIYQSAVMVAFAVIVISANQVFQLSMAALLAFLLVLQRFAPRVGLFTEYRHWWLGASHSMDRIEQLIRETDQVSAALVDGALSFQSLERAITFQDVHFQYAAQTEAALNGVSFTIPRGQMTAVVGGSGAGKSTLLDLIARFYDPTCGQIQVDGRDLRELQIATWRQAIGMVSQDTFLFNDTIKNNVRYGNLTATHEEIEQAARQAYAHEFITQMPQGYQTTVGERGVKLWLGSASGWRWHGPCCAAHKFCCSTRPPATLTPNRSSSSNKPSETSASPAPSSPSPIGFRPSSMPITSSSWKRAAWSSKALTNSFWPPTAVMPSTITFNLAQLLEEHYESPRYRRQGHVGS